MIKFNFYNDCHAFVNTYKFNFYYVHFFSLNMFLDTTRVEVIILFCFVCLFCGAFV